MSETLIETSELEMQIRQLTGVYPTNLAEFNTLTGEPEKCLVKTVKPNEINHENIRCILSRFKGKFNVMVLLYDESGNLTEIISLKDWDEKASFHFV